MKILKNSTKASILALAFPMLAFAADIRTILYSVKDLLNIIISILFVLVTLVFIWGIVEYITAGGAEEKLKAGKRHMIWGIVGMAVMAGAWGIVRIILDYFGVSSGTSGVNIPTF